MTVADHIKELKTMLQTSEDCSAIFQKFLSLIDIPAYRTLGKFKKSQLLDDLVIKALKSINFPDPFGLKYNFIRRFNFYHGAFMSNFLPGGVFFFKDIHEGMICILRDMHGNNSYFRIKGLPLPADEGFIVDKKSETNH